MKRVIRYYFLLVGILVVQQATAIPLQTQTQWKDLLDAYCEEHYKDCFGQAYIEISTIEDINKVSDRKVNVRGKVEHTSFFGSVYKREFKATITVLRDKVEVIFKRKGYSRMRGEFWKECSESSNKY